MIKPLSALKDVLVPHGVQPRTVPVGLLSGIRLNLDLSNGMQVYAGLAERELAPWFRRFATGIRAAFDVGGSDGTYTLFLLRKTQAERVFTFEPEPEALERLRSNLRLNRLEDEPRLTLIPKYCSSRDDAVHCSLDSLADQVADPILVKMDIEGGELDALKGASKLLDKPDVRWIIETHSHQLDEACRALFRERRYHVQTVPPAPFRAVIPELRPGGQNGWFVAFR